MGPPASAPGAGFPPEGDVLAVDDEVASYADLAVVAVLCDYWEPFVRGSARGAYLAGAGEVDEVALRQAAERFRRERDLVAADELRAWMAARSLDRSEWHDALVRGALRAADEGGGEAGRGRGGPPASEADEADTLERLRVDAFCSGLWARSAHQAVDWLISRRLAPATRASGPATAAVQPGAVVSSLSASGICVQPERVEAIAGWQDAYATVRARLSSDAGLAQTIRQRELDWTSFDVEELVLGSETAAREALMCTRDDGMALEDILLRSGGRVDAHRWRADSLPPAVAAELLAASVGSGVVGPVRHAEGWSVMWLRGRHRPALTDEDVRREAAGGLLRDALDREIVGHLRCLGPL